jgi:hypothetical protein
MDYIVELEPGTLWLAPWVGDPGRTCVRESAKRYKTKRGAQIAMGMAQMFRTFPEAKVVDVKHLAMDAKKGGKRCRRR